MFFISHSQFYWQRNWSSESSHVPKVTQLESGRAGIWIQVYLIPMSILIIITLAKAKYWKPLATWDFPGGSDGKESACNAGNLSFNPWVRRREWQPTLVFLPRKFHEQRSLVSYSPWDHRVGHNWVTNTHAHTHTHTHIRPKNRKNSWANHGVIVHPMIIRETMSETGPGWAKFWWISRWLWEGESWWCTCVV